MIADRGSASSRISAFAALSRRRLLAAGRELLREIQRLNRGGLTRLAAKGLSRRAAVRRFKAILVHRYETPNRCC